MSNQLNLLIAHFDYIVGDFDGKVGKNKVVFTKETYFKIRSK